MWNPFKKKPGMVLTVSAEILTNIEVMRAATGAGSNKQVIANALATYEYLLKYCSKDNRTITVMDIHGQTRSVPIVP